MGNVIAVIGAQWGDEGKGKIVDYLAKDCKIAVRFNGGNNAGHSVETEDGTRRKVHLLPSSAFRDGAVCVLANGMVISPDVLLQEIEKVMEVNANLTVLVDGRAHVLTTEHISRDVSEETLRKVSIGTTKSGNGPAYSDKAARSGTRICDLAYYSKSIRDRMGYMLVDGSRYLNAAIDSGEGIIFAGAHGTMLDIDHGTYPYVTSSNCITSAIGTGAGVDPRRLTNVVGVVKAYSTRIGAGPFPTEMDEVQATLIREKGREFGTTTGRPRRIGWLDGPALGHAMRVNQFDYLAVTMLDVLSVVDEIKVCVAYGDRDNQYGMHPSSEIHSGARCIYYTVPGWPGEDLSQYRTYRDLPANVKDYLGFIESIAGARVGLISVGPRRDQIIDRRGEWK